MCRVAIGKAPTTPKEGIRHVPLPKALADGVHMRCLISFRTGSPVPTHIRPQTKVEQTKPMDSKRRPPIVLVMDTV